MKQFLACNHGLWTLNPHEMNPSVVLASITIFCLKSVHTENIKPCWYLFNIQPFFGKFGSMPPTLEPFWETVPPRRVELFFSHFGSTFYLSGWLCISGLGLIVAVWNMIGLWFSLVTLCRIVIRAPLRVQAAHLPQTYILCSIRAILSQIVVVLLYSVCISLAFIGNFIRF